MDKLASVLLLITFSYTLCAGAIIGEACSEDSDCLNDNSVCSGVPGGCSKGTCICDEGFNWDNIANCRQEVAFGDACISSVQCPGVSVPDKGLIANQGSCDAGFCGCEGFGSEKWQINPTKTFCEWALRKELEAACFVDKDCFYYTGKTGECDGNKLCACPTGMEFDATLERCRWRNFGEPCDADSACHPSKNLNCDAGACVCNAGTAPKRAPVRDCDTSECDDPVPSIICLDDAAELSVKPGEACKMLDGANYVTDSTGKYCQQGYECFACPEGGDNVCRTVLPLDTAAQNETPVWKKLWFQIVMGFIGCLAVLAIIGVVAFFVHWCMHRAANEPNKYAPGQHQKELKRHHDQLRQDFYPPTPASTIATQTKQPPKSNPPIRIVVSPAHRGHQHGGLTPPPTRVTSPAPLPPPPEVQLGGGNGNVSAQPKARDSVLTWKESNGSRDVVW